MNRIVNTNSFRLFLYSTQWNHTYLVIYIPTTPSHVKKLLENCPRNVERGLLYLKNLTTRAGLRGPANGANLIMYWIIPENPKPG